MLAAFVFAQPALAYGLVAAGIPILVHLLLRPRPRRVRFPAIALLREVFAQGQRAHRLRNWTLLLLRALLVALAVLLLAGPTWTPPAAEFVGDRPAACVVVLDDSASMSYRADGRTLLESARAGVIELIDGSAAWAAGSALAVVSAGADEPGSGWTADRAALIEALPPATPEARHARTLAGALRSAAGLLRTAEEPARRIVVFTDGAAHAWRDVTPGILAGIDGLAVRVIVPPAGVRSNLALLAAKGPARLHSAAAPIPISATILAEGVEGECWLLAQQDGRTLQRWDAPPVATDTAREAALELPAMPAGPHGLVLRLEPPDRMSFDQQRYVVFQTAPPPVVWLVSPPSTGAATDVSSLILRNLLAPEILPAEQQLVELHALDAAQFATALPQTEPKHRPVLTVILSGAAIPPAAVQTLLHQVEGGAVVLLAPASSGRDADWPELRQPFSPAAPTDEQIALTSLRWEPASPYAAVEELGELTRCGVRRRLRLENLRDGTVVHARYSDDVPAIVSKRVGAGQIFVLTTSPDPQWSDLGVRAAGLMSWLHNLVDEAAGSPDAVAEFGLGETTRFRFGGLPATGQVRVSLQSDSAAPSVWRRLVDGAPVEPWPTDRAGLYSVSAAGDGGRAVLYAVNWPPEESRLEPVALPQLRQLLGCENVRLDAPGAGQPTTAATLLDRLRGLRDLRKPLAALLLAAFLLESLLAARGRAGSAAPRQIEAAA